MEDFSLQGILESLEKQAGVEKQAAADPEKKEKTDEEKAKEEAECAGQAAGKAKKDIEEAEGKNGKEQTKEAATVGADLAKAVLEKVATLQLNQVKTEENMNKQAAEAGKALANALLEKLASVGDMNTENGISTGVPNKTQVDLAAQEAEQAAIIHVQPGTDGRGNGGTVNLPRTKARWLPNKLPIKFRLVPSRFLVKKRWLRTNTKKLLQFRN
jgi:hypothetical protein